MILSIPTPSRQTTSSHSADQATNYNMTPVLSIPSPLGQQSNRLMRPKLSISTTQNRSFGKGSSLRLETLSAISPTIRNTFSNGYEPAKQSEDSISRCSDTPITPAESNTPSSLSSASEASAILEPHSIPYSQPHQLKSALVNSPIPRSELRRMSVNPSRPFFPQQKRVSFRDPLSEDVKTVKYILSHYDVADELQNSIDASEAESLSDASESSTITLTTASSTSSTNEPTQQLRLDPPPNTNLRRVNHRRQLSLTELTGPQTGDKRDSSSDESDSDKCPETPVAGRRKRVREWTWTLGSLPSTEDVKPPLSDNDQTTQIALPEETSSNEPADYYMLSPQATPSSTYQSCISPWSSAYPSPESPAHNT